MSSKTIRQEGEAFCACYRQGVLSLERHGEDFAVEALARELPPEWIRDALKHTGRASVRKRLLAPTFITWFVILMGLFRRTSYKNLLEKVDDTWWASERWSPEKPPTTSAVTKARDRIGTEPMKLLFERSAQTWLSSSEGLMFHGRRVAGIDGSTMKTPDTEQNDRHFGRPGSSRGLSAFPQMRVAALVDIGTHLVTAERHGPHRSAEINLARDLVCEIEKGSIVLLDRDFLGYALPWGIYHTRGADVVVRVKKNIKPRFLRHLGPGDAIVEVAIPRYYRQRRPGMPE